MRLYCTDLFHFYAEALNTALHLDGEDEAEKADEELTEQLFDGLRQVRDSVVKVDRAHHLCVDIDTKLAEVNAARVAAGRAPL